MRINYNSPFRKENQPVRRSRPHFSQKTWSPGEPLPPSHIKVNALETLRRHAEAFERFQRDEQARMDRTGRRAA
jgi:hypothetical protein